MMKSILPLLLSIFAFNCFAQNEPSDFTGHDLRQREQAHQTDRFHFMPNEIIVKFKDDVSLSDESQLKSTGINSIDNVLKSAGIEKMEKLFPQAKKLKSATVVKTPLGQDMVIPNLHNIYKIILPELKSNQPQQSEVHKYIQEIKQQPEVEYAEPNYIYSIGDFSPAGPEMTMLEAMEQPSNYNVSEAATGLIPSDPLYNSQWGIPATKIDVVWNMTTGDTAAVIAILDTGVDGEHPDLKSNIWRNTKEIPGNGIDDDGNGKIDDAWGWDFINNDNEPKDDNSHGTHVAGIAAAAGDNGIGIAGANWKAKIMPVKVFQSSGRGDAATIAQGITYAAENGATVLNMSFGSYAESLAMRDALANAYATAVLVAAAGNDATPIGPCMGCAPMFPAAFSFVLGVEANKEQPAPCGIGAPIIRACFSNFDQNGPVFSNYTDLLNYEMKAPGARILSTVPGGNYREYNGTSMASPLVAGAVSLYRQQNPGESQELLFGNLIHSTGQHLDLDAALNIIPEPRLDIVSYDIIDTLNGDGDGRPDAGEIIELKVMVRNTWGQANDVNVGIEFEEFEDTSTAEILTDSALVGSVSAYATRFNAVPLKLQIASDVADGRDIVFRLRTWYGNRQGESSAAITINVENGVELKGVLNEDMTLYPDRHYIITDNLAVAEGVTLTIKPGTTLKFATDKSLVTAGNIVAIGKPDSLITFTKRDLSNSWKGIKIGNAAELIIDFAMIEYGGIFEYWNSALINADYPYDGKRKIYLSNINFKYNWGYISTIMGKITNNVFTRNYMPWDGLIYFQFENLSNNILIDNESYYDWGNSNGAITTYLYSKDSIINNSLSNNFLKNGKEINIRNRKTEFSIIKLPSNYYGTSNKLKINNGIYDFEEDGSLALIDISNKTDVPSKQNHGHVWKILVNGIDAQDEFPQLDPIGVGRQKVEVYFNRAMETQVIPKVSMGVRYPFTQTAISEEGSWSADSTIYTVYAKIGLTTGDGINTIRVSGAEDTDHFEIPIEDRRFKIIVNAAGSLSSGFAATPGMGKVDLAWENPQEGVDDLLGYNMYRYTFINDSVTSDTVRINANLVTGTSFTDFAVAPATKYFYTYKTVRTNLSESDLSNVVAAVPLTAVKGDANGDLLVNVSDIVTLSNHIMENNPAPFIFEAADINGDEIINVLDIVGLVNIILTPEGQSLKGLIAENAEISIEDGIVYVNSSVKLGGIQFTISDVNSEQEVQIMEALSGFEVAKSLNEGKLTILAYSLSGKTIGEGKSALLKLISGNSWIYDAVLSNPNGTSVSWNFTGEATGTDLLKINAGFELGQNYPNPFTGTTTIPFELEMNVEEAVISVHDIMGRAVGNWQLKNLNSGSHKVEWQNNSRQGIFLYKMHVKQDGLRSYTKTKRMVVQ